MERYNITVPEIPKWKRIAEDFVIFNFELWIKVENLTEKYRGEISDNKKKQWVSQIDGSYDQSLYL